MEILEKFNLSRGYDYLFQIMIITNRLIHSISEVNEIFRACPFILNKEANG